MNHERSLPTIDGLLAYYTSYLFLGEKDHSRRDWQFVPAPHYTHEARRNK